MLIAKDVNKDPSPLPSPTDSESSTPTYSDDVFDGANVDDLPIDLYSTIISMTLEESDALCAEMAGMKIDAIAHLVDCVKATALRQFTNGQMAGAVRDMGQEIDAAEEEKRDTALWDEAKKSVTRVAELFKILRDVNMPNDLAAAVLAPWVPSVSPTTCSIPSVVHDGFSGPRVESMYASAERGTVRAGAVTQPDVAALAKHYGATIIG